MQVGNVALLSLRLTLAAAMTDESCDALSPCNNHMQPALVSRCLPPAAVVTDESCDAMSPCHNHVLSLM